VGYDFPKEVEKLLSGVVQARDKLERTIAQGKSEEAKDQAELASKREQERLQKTRLAAYEAQLERTVIRATKPGLVVYSTSGSNRGWSNDSPIQQGTRVRENQALLTIPDADSLGAVVNIHESSIEKVEKGQRVSVVVDAIPDLALHGVVEKKARLPNASDRWMNPDLKVYATQIRLDGSHPTLQPGMSVRVEIEVATVPNVLVVPLQAVAGRAGAPTVWVVEGENVAERRVVLGASNDTFVEVKEGVREGDRVLLSPPRAPRPSEEKPAGEEGKPAPPEAPAAAAPPAPAPARTGEEAPRAEGGREGREGRPGGGRRSREGRGGGGPPPGR
jgi:HlyD family secretion protein